MHGLEQALAAIAAACSVGTAWAEMAESGASELPLSAAYSMAKCVSPQSLENLDEHQAKQWLANEGFSIPESIVVDSSEAAVAAATKIGYPVVVKAVSKEILHKTEAAAVAVNLQDSSQVEAHASRMLGYANLNQFQLMVEKMVTDVVAEMLVGIGYDPQFGHYLIIGFGGALVELIGDRELLLPPVNRDMVKRAIDRLQTAPLLYGYRGRAHANIESVIDSVLLLNQLLEKHANDIVEIEINPLMIKSEKHAAVVADALITMRAT